MKIVIDGNMGSRRLSRLLQAAGHDVTLAVEVGLHEVSDARILTWSIGESRPVLTRNHSDFADLHDLTIAAGGTRPGILVVRFDNDPRNNLTDRGFATAVKNLEASGMRVAGQLHILNHWR
jgi:predicted nuclease of predicted toxin-antitoxin system